MRRLLGLLMMISLAGCSPDYGPNPPKTVDSVDLNRYQGTWYEIARLPMIYQRDCLQSEAHYKIIGDNELSVINRCRTDKGTIQEAEGTAWPQEEGQSSRFWVRFHSLISYVLPWMTRGHYWVLYLDPEYSMSLVGSPDHKFLWLLAREPQLSQAERDVLLKVATEQGYDVKSLIWSGPAK